MTTADTAQPISFKLGGEIEIHRIGIGTNRIQNDDASRAILPAALELGVNLIDTADIYSSGVSEQVIGETIASDPRAHVATKGGYHGASPERIAAAIDASRARLGLETIDLYYLHRPDKDFPDRAVDRPDSQREAGRTRAPHRPVERDARPARPCAQPHADRRSPERTTTSRTPTHEDVIDYCERHSIMFVPYFPLRGSERAKKIADRLTSTATRSCWRRCSRVRRLSFQFPGLATRSTWRRISGRPSSLSRAMTSRRWDSAQTPEGAKAISSTVLPAGSRT